MVAGHRGASAHAPENTIASLRLAFSKGARGAEFDVQYTADGVVVVLHDDTLERTARPWHEVMLPTTEAEYRKICTTHINKLRYDDVRSIDVGSEEWPNQTVSTLEEVLALLTEFPEDHFFLCEVKGGDLGVVGLVRDVVEKSQTAPKQLKMIGFDVDCMIATKRAMPTFESYYLAMVPDEDAAIKHVDATIAAGLDGVDFFADPACVTTRVCEYAHSRGLPVLVWCWQRYPESDTLPTFKAISDNGVDVFTSDLPSEMIDSEVFKQQLLKSTTS